MNKFAFSLILLTVTLVWPLSLSADVNDFYIESFIADYHLSVDELGASQMFVEEEIMAVFPDFDQNHGILRAIPNEYKGYSLNVDVESVTDEFGNSLNYTTYEENNNLVLRIGDADTFVHGTTTYRIAYNLQNVITFYDTHDELYWDANGDQWLQNFGRVEATLHLPEELEGRINKELICFTGVYGSTENDCQISERVDEVVFSANDLTTGETLTFVIGFEKGIFQVPPKPINYGLILLVLIPLGTLIYMWRRWYRLGRDPKGRGVIVRQYEPPKEFTSLSANALLNEGRLEAKAVTAAIIELAVSGYITIIENEKKVLFITQKNYELELKRDVSQAPEDLQKVAKALFGDDPRVGERVAIEDKKNKLAKDFKEMSQEISADLHKNGYFENDPMKTRRKYLISLIFFIVLVWLAFMFGLFLIGIGLVISGLIVAGFSFIMPVKTKAGLEAQEHILGLKDYMMQAEKGRIDVMQSPEGALKFDASDDNAGQKVHIFEQLLPYAMLFGIEKGWSELFRDLYKEAPDWYRGNVGSFNAIVLADSLGNFSKNSSAMFAPPSSSGGSGFSGGGFSGGGGGGGGGGGW